MCGAGVLRPLDGLILGLKERHKSLKSYVAPVGVSSIAKHYIDRSKAKLKTGKRLVSIEMVAPAPEATADATSSDAPAASIDADSNPVVDLEEPSARKVSPATASAPAPAAAPGPQWLVKCEDGSSEVYDAVVITTPVPQILSLGGDLPALLEGSGALPGLKAVQYSSRYTLVLYFGPSDWARVQSLFPYTGRYVSSEESDSIRWIGVDSAKRGVMPVPATAGTTGTGAAGGAGSDSAAAAGSAATAAPAPEPCASVVLQTSIEFGAMYLDTEPDKVEPIILDQLRRLVPGLPEPVETKCHRWRYSQVVKGYKGPEPFISEFRDEPLHHPDYYTNGSAASPAGTAATASTTIGGSGSILSSAASAIAGSHGSRLGGAEAAAAAASSSPSAKDGKGIASLSAAASNVGALMIVDDPPLLLAGDAFAESNFEGCATSAEKVTSLLLQALSRGHVNVPDEKTPAGRS